MSTELHRADPRVRRIAIVGLLVAAVFGTGALWALPAWLDSGQRDLDGLLLLASGLVVVLATIGVALGYVLWQEAANILREDRFPPSDMRTLRDVPVLHGKAAARYALWMRAGAVVSALAGLGVLVWSYRLLRLVV